MKEKTCTHTRSDLLTTKLSIPILRSKIVKRNQLIDLFHAGMRCKVMLIVAPAGYGKTTAIREWMVSTRAIDWPVAWVSLDKGDNGLLQFWSYIIGAIKTIKPDLPQDLLGFIDQNSSTSDFHQLTPLLNQIATIPRHFSLVMDDFHEIKTPLIHQTMTYFIDHLPDNMHLVFASREVLPAAKCRQYLYPDFVYENN